MVACQWNCYTVLAVDVRSLGRLPGNSRILKKVKHTRSSPIGPAEHDEGGSLQQEPLVLVAWKAPCLALSKQKQSVWMKKPGR